MISVTETIGMTTYRAGSNAPSTAKHRVRGALPYPVYLANTATGAVTWDDNEAGGTFEPYGVNNAAAVYYPKNKSQNVVISATDPTNTHTRALTVVGTMPIQPQVGFETELDVETKIKLARDRTRYFREDGDPEIGWAFGWEKRELDQKAELLEFWFDHRKVVQFYMVDVEGNIQNKVWFNSSFKYTTDGANRFAMAATFKGVYEGVTAEEAEPIHLRINAGGYPAEDWTADQYHTNGYTFYWSATPDSTGVTDPAPDAVYYTFRYDAPYLEYLVTGLRPNAAHKLRLHFMVGDFSTYVMTPQIQGVSLTNITLNNGQGECEAYDYLDVDADMTGQIRFRLTYVSGGGVGGGPEAAFLSGFEVIENV